MRCFMDFFDKQTIYALRNKYDYYLTEVKKLSVRTRSQYLDILGQFLRNEVLGKVELENYKDIVDYHRIINFSRYRKTTIVRAAIIGFLECLKYDGLIDQKFYFEYPHIDKGTSRDTQTFLSLEEIRFIFSKDVYFVDEEEAVVGPLVYALTFFCCFSQKHLKELKVSDVILEEKLIRNPRQAKQSYLLQWIQLNDYTFNCLTKYFEYRNGTSADSDSLLIIRGEPVGNTGNLNSMFLLFNDRIDNYTHLSHKPNGQLLIRSMLLYSLISTKGQCLSQLSRWMELKSNEQLEKALKEYLENYSKLDNMILNNLEDTHKSVSLEELITGYEETEEILDNNQTEENDEVAATADNQDNDETSLYSEDDDLTMDDLFNFEQNSPRNLTENKITIQRLVRDSNLVKGLKEKYNYTCQLCGCRLRNSRGGFTSEAHHIKPYNRTHRGDDTYRNVVVLCPNCHTQFDDLYYGVNPETLKVHCLFEDDRYHLATLNWVNGHKLGNEYLEYTWRLFLDKKA